MGVRSAVDVGDNVLDYDIEVSDFELHSGVCSLFLGLFFGGFFFPSVNTFLSIYFLYLLSIDLSNFAFCLTIKSR